MQEVDIELNLKGVIRYACGCKAQILVYKGTRGQTSIKCPVCGKYCLLDYDAMTATGVKPLRKGRKRT